ncbi:ribonucleoside-diphosphate reductase subunit alpha [Cellulomonas carbonis]|uniref:Ribonucleoside-diphosphate reductase n=1 Tax=Cellulomonas carbonis T26 TaxID=947969 RepID=A0A0A0BTY4_9CELL|nr:ribonucleoside-diphosphate reductase subunit alpha [Cellulomonas carbonis]KGM10609.1 ribonucleotide-diphosphate reductase subunit alpha [Cellulomonas carbonis T26]GGC07087.1 ribonucleoside-diphosphate reductase [Cellulomonas carbonis]
MTLTAPSPTSAPGADDAVVPVRRVHVTKRDGTQEPYDADRINRAIERAAVGLPDQISKVTQIASELAITLFDGITTEQLDEAAVAVAVQNVKDDPDFDTIAARLLRKVIYKRVLGGYETDLELALLHQARFPGYVRDAVEDGLLDPRLVTHFDLDALAAALDHHHDERLRYIGTVTMRNRYMINDRHGRPLEVPQYFWMRVAMGLSLNEERPTEQAVEFYRRIARLEYLPAGSTLVNAGTSYPQLSNCFVMQMDDDIEHIATSVRNVMWLTKGTGGIGLSVTKLRSEGSPIRSNNTTSTGPIPFMHTIDSTLRAVSRGGKKFGALCFYMENWHLDFPQFLDLRQNSGDPYRRTRTANTAVWISDEFMKRVAADDDWYLFDPADTPDLVELVGSAFSARYAEYVADAQAGRIRRFRRMKAREQWTAMLISLQTTSHPWLTWKDSINARALNDNTGTIHLSNLCTEICLPQDRDTIAVCNLASINLAAHLVDGELDWDRMRASVRLAVRQLDNLVDITLSSVDESERANRANRAVGLGVMGFTDVTERLGYAYESEEAYELIDRVVEFISYHAIDASADLARERGPYANFAGSGWSKGLVPIDTLDRLEADRGVPVQVDRTVRLDWDVLREKVAGGMRNATLMAIAPTASIGLVAGTTPGLDPQFSQIFSRATSSGKFLEVNRNLVHDLQRLGIWEDVRDDLLAAQGDLSAVPGVPEHLRAVYRTSFDLSPYAFVEVAARAQKWIDQAISRNIYLASRDVGEMAALYQAAWERGVKTTYYLHMKPRHTAEQSTVRVNKAEVRPGAGVGGAGGAASAPTTTPRRGFGFASAAPTTATPVATVRPSGVDGGPAPALVPTTSGAPAAPSAPSVGATAPARGGFGFGRVASPSAVAQEAAPSTTQPDDAPSSAVVPDVVLEVTDVTDVVDGVACPVDPMERLQCESCQ